MNSEIASAQSNVETRATARCDKPDRSGGSAVADPRTLVNEAAVKLLAMAEGRLDKSATERIAAGVRRLNLGLFRLVVMGEIKKGKSSFINALLGNDALLPTDSEVATSTVFKLIYGPRERYQVFFSPDPETGATAEPKAIGRGELAEYGTEHGNPANEKCVDFIGVELPHPLLQSGLVIVDTPGVGGLFAAHRDITWRFAPSADAVVFVLDSVEAVISADEIRFLKELTGRFTRRVVFVQTKIDAADEPQWRAWELRNKEVLARELGIPKPQLFYFPLSAKEKRLADASHDLEDLAQSGYPPLLGLLRGVLIPGKERTLARWVADELVAVASQLRQEAASELAVCRKTSAEALQGIEEQRRAALEQFKLWQEEFLRTSARQARESLNQLIRKTRDAIAGHLDPRGHLFADFKEQLIDSKQEADVLAAMAQTYQQELVAGCADAVEKELTRFRGEYCRIIGSAGGAATEPAGTSQDAALQLDYRRHESLRLSQDAWSSIQSSVIGAGIGMSGSNLALMAVSMVFPPAAGFAMLAYAGGAVLGLTKGLEQHQRRLREEVLAKLEKVLVDTLHQIGPPVLRQFEERATECVRRFEQHIELALTERKSHLDRELEQVKAARSRSQTEIKQTIDAAERRIALLDHTVRPLVDGLLRPAKP